MMKIVFCVLHYQATDITKQCICKLLNLDLGDSEIVIVDNGSTNDSGRKLQQEYKNIKKIHVIINKKNDGFARGNNVAYKYAKHKLKADTVVVMNNDIMIEQKDFVQLLSNIDISNKDIIAPDVINLSEVHQNPFRKHRISKRETLWVLGYNLLMYVLYKIPLLNIHMVKILEKRNNNITKLTKGNHKKEECENIVPHGSIVIFTKKYVDTEEIAFIPETFLFCEEDILYEYALHKKYMIWYMPLLKVIHHEDVSINTVTKNELERRKFITRKKVKSAFVLLKYRVLKCKINNYTQ